MKRGLYISIITLTLVDIIFTTWGLSVNIIVEVNPLFAVIYEYSFLFAIIGVILLTGGGLYIVNKLYEKSKIAKSLLCCVVVIKVYVVYLHLTWFIPVIPLLIHRYKVMTTG